MSVYGYWKLAALLIVGLLLASCAAPSSTERAAPPSASQPRVAAPAQATPVPLRKLKMAYAFTSAEVMPVFVALEQGIYRKHGLDVETTYLQSSAQVGPAMMAGEIDVALTGGSGVVDINLAGGDQVILASQNSNLMRFFLHARPDIQRLEELRGQRIAITRLGTGVHLATQIALERIGMEAGRDVQMLQAGTTESQVTSLVNNAVAAAMLSVPGNLIAQREGFPLLFDARDLSVPYSVGVLAVTRATLEARTDVIRDFLAAQIEAIGTTRRERAAGVRAIGQIMQSDDQEVLERSYDIWLGDVTETAQPSIDALRSVIDQRAGDTPAARGADPNTFVDPRLLRELTDSGYVRQHLGR